ncbi:hypothetical protein QTN47_11330 [Danxiaibacter flavus]|uniref:Uncharacterized protein n=1 Tax=Danxiaibacter flavus TaxID=3049108 RepID=A0ABV3ZDY5_9BACT|nr:hypothetical protein QNM32_11335 [Chitinophagaceae bacterium DXS]
MHFYRRNIKLKLALVRLTFTIILPMFYLLTKFSLTDYVILSAIILIVLSLLPIPFIAIGQEDMVVKKYYLFGLLSFTWTFNPSHEITLQSFETEMISDENAPLLVSSFLGWIITVMPSPALKLQRFQLKSVDIDGNQIQVKLKLNSTEYYLLKNFISKQTH